LHRIQSENSEHFCECIFSDPHLPDSVKCCLLGISATGCDVSKTLEGFLFLNPNF